MLSILTVPSSAGAFALKTALTVTSDAGMANVLPVTVTSAFLESFTEIVSSTYPSAGEAVTVTFSPSLAVTLSTFTVPLADAFRTTL